MIAKILLKQTIKKGSAEIYRELQNVVCCDIILQYGMLVNLKFDENAATINTNTFIKKSNTKSIYSLLLWWGSTLPIILLQYKKVFMVLNANKICTAPLKKNRNRNSHDNYINPQVVTTGFFGYINRYNLKMRKLSTRVE